MLKKVDGTVYVTGENTKGELGVGSALNQKSFASAILPNTVTTANKVKYIKAGRTTSMLMLANGEVWVSGSGEKGELRKPRKHK